MLIFYIFINSELFWLRIFIYNRFFWNIILRINLWIQVRVIVVIMGYSPDWLRRQPFSHLIILKWPSWFRLPGWRIAWALILPIIYFMLLNFCIYKMGYLHFIEGLLLMFGKLGLEVPFISMDLGRLRIYKINKVVFAHFSLQLLRE